jgi:hypothetical protein
MIDLHPPILTIDSAGNFSHDDAARLSQRALLESSPLVILDLHRAANATTAAFARLILLRRTLLRSGRDLRLSGLRGEVIGLYEINRLHAVLPQV